MPALRAVVSGADRVRRAVPGAQGVALGAGSSYWQWAVQAGLGGEEAGFPLPERLQRA